MPQPTRPALQFDDHMSDADALMWNLETDPVLRSTILSLWVLDRAPDAARLTSKLEHAARIIPRLRQRVVADPLGIATPKWEPDPDFDLRFHVRHSRAQAPGGVRELLDLAEPLAMQAFDKDRPLWELHLVDGLADGRFGVILKLHHAISDGVGLVRMTECLIERGPEEEPVRSRPADAVPADEAPPSEADAWSRVAGALRHRLRVRRERWARLAAGARQYALPTLRRPWSAARRVGETLASAGRVLAPASEPLSPLMTERSTGVHFDTLPLSLDELKRAGRAAGGTVNDAFVAGVAGGLARYHAALGAPVDSLRMLMPINVRTGEKGNRAGNQFAPARFEVPVGIPDPVRRMREIGRLCRAQRDEPALPWVDEISSVLGVLPPALAVGLFGAMQKTTDFTTSNVPGPRRPTWMSGARVESVLPFGPLAGAAVNLSVFSYDGVMHVGINSDPAAVGDPGLLLECLRKGFDEVLAVVA